jgi:hypothetical protein
MSATARPWVAVFDDGPCAGGPEHVFVVGPVWDEIELAPMPAETNLDHWVIVGGDQIGACEHPWPGQVTYRLDRLVIVNDADDVAHYSLVQAPSAAPNGTRATDAGSKPSAR